MDLYNSLMEMVIIENTTKEYIERRSLQEKCIFDLFKKNNKSEYEKIKSKFKSIQEYLDFEHEAESILRKYLKDLNIANYTKSIINKLDIDYFANAYNPESKIGICTWKGNYMYIIAAEIDYSKFAKSKGVDKEEYDQYADDISEIWCKFVNQLNKNKPKSFNFEFVVKEDGDKNWKEHGICIKIPYRFIYNLWKENTKSTLN